MSTTQEAITETEADETTDLPEGWTTGTIGDLIGSDGVFTDGDWVESKDQDPNGDVRLVQLADIGDGNYKDKSRRFLTSAKAKELGCSFLKRGDILIARMPDPLGRACLFPGDPKPSVTAVDVCIIRGGRVSADQRWIADWINTPMFRRRIEGLSRGTTRKRISRKNLEAIEFPIPPLPEQKRIVAKIEELFKEVNKGRERLQRVPKILKRFRQSVLAAACSGRLTEDWREHHPDIEPAEKVVERLRARRKAQSGKRKKSIDDEPDASDLPELPPGWVYCRFGLLTDYFRGGSTAPPDNEETPFPILRSSSVRPGHVDLTDVKYLSRKQSQRSENYVKEGDLLLTRLSGSIDYVANCALVRVLNGRRIQYPDRLFCARVCADVSAEYVERVFAAPVMRRQIEKASRSSAGHQRVSISDLEERAIALPPLGEQHEIVRRVEALFKLADRIEERVETATRRSDKLTQAILAKAFRGELVPTEAELARQEGRDYKTAAELLARIKADREKTQATTKKKTKRKPRKKKAK